LLTYHTHTDDFRVIGAASGSQAFVLVDPPVSPIYEQNPSFRVVSFRGDGTLEDQTTHYLSNLTEASSTVRGIWQREYTFSKESKAKTVDFATLRNVYDRVTSEDGARAEWFKLYDVSHPPEDAPPQEIRDLYCAMGSVDVESYESCYCPPAP
jgi:hypothetical protein